MGFTTIKLKLCHLADPSRQEEVELLVDTGALYSVVPRQLLESIGVEEIREEKFVLADGTAIRRRIGAIMFILEGKRGPSPVVFGEPGDKPLLGVVTLESLGLEVDPTTKTLRPVPHYLMSQSI